MFTDLVYWDHAYNMVLFVNFIIVIGLFTGLRFFSGTISHTNATYELITKDNPAFGVSMAAVIFAIAILLSGVMYGDFDIDVLNSAISVGLYGVIGIIFMAITRVIFDKFALPQISLQDEIIQGNMAVAIADGANVIAAAVIIRAAMVWVNTHTIGAVAVLCMLYVVSQIILTVVTLIRIRIFKRQNPLRSIQEELQDGNIAMALSFAGRKISTALAIAIASRLVVHEMYDLVPVVVAWAVVSIVLIVAVKIISFIAMRIVLVKVDVMGEIVEQRNIAMGVVQGMIYVAVALLLTEV